MYHDQVVRSGTNFHAVVHAQPRHLTTLSHIPRCQYEPYLNRHLLRWQPELIAQLPEGSGHVPFLVPGSSELMAATLESLDLMKKVELSGEYTQQLALLEEIKGLPFGAMWDYHCLKHGVPVGLRCMDEVRAYEKRVLAKRA